MNWKRALADSGVAALLALALSAPIMGMVLRATDLEFHLPRAAAAVAAVFLGRLALLALVDSGLLDRWRALWVPVGWAWDRAAAQAERRAAWILPLVVLLLVLFPFSPIGSNYLLQIFTLSLIYVMLGMGLNIVVGLAGLLDLGYVAFYAVGAYAFALLAKHFDFSFWMSLPAAAALAACAGALLGFPVLRMHGDYLAIVTLGFGEIIRIVLNNMLWLTGGPNGISAPRPTLFGLVFAPDPGPGQTGFHEFLGLPHDAGHRYAFIYLLMLGFVAGSIWIFKRLREMPIGRAWEALREDEVACKALGINHTTTKLSAFMLGATFAGVGGVFFAGAEGFINPASFTFIESAIILSIVVLGGMGSILGVVLAALALTLLPELFRQFEDYRMLFFGLAMVFVMVWRPGGLLRVRRRSHEEPAHA
jgi:branched-chain amino acid transport system permease protein